MRNHAAGVTDVAGDVSLGKRAVHYHGIIDLGVPVHAHTHDLLAPLTLYKCLFMSAPFLWWENT